MNKDEIITAVSNKSGLSKKDSELALLAFLTTVEETLKSGEKVSLAKFGVFERKIVKGREGICKIPTAMDKAWKTEDSYGVKFSAGKALKDSLN
jgi:DNA-binding protein HU-beta